MNLTDRDKEILNLVYRFKFCLGRHIKVLGNFTGSRASDRRLKILVEAGYLARKKIIYGVPFIYTLTHMGRLLIGANKREDKIRIDRLTHDIYVLDTVIYFIEKYGISLKVIESEKELHIKDGYGARKHQPDFMFTKDGESCAVEIELNAYKTKEVLEKNIRDNYMGYDRQIWLVNHIKAYTMLQKFTDEYSNIKILRLEEVIEHIKDR